MRILVKCLAILAVLLPGPAFAQAAPPAPAKDPDEIF